MSLHVKSHYTRIDPLAGVEFCCSCKWVAESPGGARHGVSKEGMGQSVGQNNVTKGQPDFQGPAIPMPSQTRCSSSSRLSFKSNSWKHK